MKRFIMAVVLIVSGVLGIFCEVTITRSKDYSIKATAFGSKIEVHTYEEIKEEMESGFDYVGSPGICRGSPEEMIDVMLSGKATISDLYFATRLGGAVSYFRSFTDLVIPVLPDGCVLEDRYSVAWSDQGFCFDFTGELRGYIYVTDRFSDPNWKPHYEDREFQKAGRWNVYENDFGNIVTVVGEKGHDRFYVILSKNEKSLSNDVLAQFDLERYVSLHPKVLMFYEVRALRLLGLAAVIGGGILLLCLIRKWREKQMA